jgi:hypothetical protein
MIKKLLLILSLGLATSAPVAVAYPTRTYVSDRETQAILSVGAGFAAIAATAYLMANHPDFFKAFGRALLEVLTDRRHYHHCCHSFWCHCHHDHGSVSINFY